MFRRRSHQSWALIPELFEVTVFYRVSYLQAVGDIVMLFGGRTLDRRNGEVVLLLSH